ncbi:5'-methylthioadenosine/S-adenosylhomocysteine nucleosidase [Pollutimonas bauzanensis]|uniref:5'-methylthioadenosine/S-adenosylhomocysteine nucleosidase n=1 Tax=Pollutimonas bauzanensis TaxID=658167 RepID=UPI001C49DEEB|nr:5'-methylthioadenosine/S-adenosylhomocysteine nucleosidase [Pollutimonas bauzanensis]
MTTKTVTLPASKNAQSTLLAGKRVIFAMAASAEYGRCLEKLFIPLLTGVGPVEASIGMSSALAGLAHAAELPDLVVCLGSAGSCTLEHGRVYQVAQVSYRDMDATVLGVPKGVTPFLDQPAVMPLPYRIPGIEEASLSTGGAVISGEAYRGIDADMVDMETYAIMRACGRFGVPLIGLRGISDGAAALTKITDWTDYLHLVDEQLAIAVEALARAIQDGTLKL